MEAAAYLMPSGRLFLEHEHYHGSAARALAENYAAYQDVRTFPDANGREHALFLHRRT